MGKILTAVIVAASVGAAAIATSNSAKAWWGWGPAVVGGVVAGAINASAATLWGRARNRWLLRLLCRRRAQNAKRDPSRLRSALEH